MSMRPGRRSNKNRCEGEEDEEDEEEEEEEDRILWYHNSPFWTIESTITHIVAPQRCSAKKFQKKRN